MVSGWTPRHAAIGAVGLDAGAVATVLVVAVGSSPGVVDWTLVVSSAFSVALGALVAWRRPESFAGATIVLLGAAPMAASAIETWGRTYATAEPMPGALIAAHLALGVWTFNLAGFVVLASSFPAGRLPGRLWRSVPWVYLGVATLLALLVIVEPDQYEADGGEMPGTTPVALPAAVNGMLQLTGACALVGVLVAAVWSVAVRYRVGDELVRDQLRWFVLAAGSVPVLLVVGWIAEALGASIALAYTPLALAIVVLLPAAVTVAMLRHDLFDIDRILNDTISFLLTTLIAAGAFAAVVTVVATSGLAHTDLGEGAGLAAGAFATALILSPLHHSVRERVGRVVDRDRFVVLGEVRAFVDRVRDGTAEPEEVEGVLRHCLADPDATVLLAVPGHEGFVTLDGRHAELDASGDRIVGLEWRGSKIGALMLGRASRRRVRRAREAVVEARLAIDVSRLRFELRDALNDVSASRLRLAEATAIERRRIERDLHDGAQQQIVAVGMRVRSAQRRLEPGDPVAQELDLAVSALENVVVELRRLAHGMRPALLDDGLGPALHSLVNGSPVPVRLQVDDVPLSEVAATTLYFVVAESLANTLKHAEASSVEVRVSSDAGRAFVCIRDDGVGGAAAGSGLTALGDRVAAIGGRLDIDSPPGRGTTITGVV